MYVCVCVRVCVCSCARTYTPSYLLKMHAYVRKYVCAHVCMYVFAHVCTDLNVAIHINIIAS